MNLEEKTAFIEALKELGLSKYDNPFGGNIQDCLWHPDNKYDGFIYLEKRVECDLAGVCEGEEPHTHRVNLTPIEIMGVVANYLKEKVVKEATEREEARQILTLLRSLR